MQHSNPARIRTRILTATGLLAALSAGAVMSGPLATAGRHEPANKVSASGSTFDVAGPNEEIILLSEQVKTSKTADLMLAVTLECSINTALTTIGDDTANASGQVDVWIEIDGEPVMVGEGDTNGEVVFCNRSYGRTTTGFDDEDAKIESFINTRTAHGFNWMALDVGSATHRIDVKARLTQSTQGDASASVVIGKRTLMIEPTKAANNEAVTELG